MSTSNLIASLPLELQSNIFELCDIGDLIVSCQLNKYWYQTIIPLIWGKIDFVRECEDHESVERSRQFFLLGDKLMDENPERWAFLASCVHELNLGRLHGINIVSDDVWDGDEYAFYASHHGEEPKRRTAFDVITQFANLNTLSVFVKNYWVVSSSPATEPALAHGLRNLKSLKIGGQVPDDIVSGLLKRPETIEHFSVINPITCLGDEDWSDCNTFLGKNDHLRFTSLKSLHLCKIGDLDGHDEDDEEEDNRNNAFGLQLTLPREAEIKVLEEWALLLTHTSSTLEELTLENHYLCGGAYNYRVGPGTINPGMTHPTSFDSFSIREIQRCLFPVLSGQWPRLRMLTLVGMGATEDVARVVSHLEPRVHIVQRLARTDRISSYFKPDPISTPVEFRCDGENETSDFWPR